MLAVVLLALVASPCPAQRDSDPKDPKAKEGETIKLDPFIAKLVEPDAKDSAVVKLQKERTRERAIYVAKTQEVIKIGNWNAAHFGEYVKEQLTFWENLAGLASKPEDKLKCAEMRVEGAKEFEKFITARVKGGLDPSQNQDFAKAARIDAELDLLKLKEALKDKK
jgi:hypothetical protein